MLHRDRHAGQDGHEQPVAELGLGEHRDLRRRRGGGESRHQLHRTASAALARHHCLTGPLIKGYEQPELALLFLTKKEVPF